MRKTLIGLALSLFLTTPGAAQQAPLPTLTQPVNDFAAVIDDPSARDLDQKIRALKATTGDAVIIVTVPTVAPFATVEEYAVKLFEKAGIGDRKLDNGLLILVAVKEHGIRVEVGYGLEGVVTDGFAGDTIRSLMVPKFRENRYGEGLLAGTSRLLERISEGRAHPEQFKKAEVTGTSFWLGLALFLLICAAVVGFIVFVIYRIAKATGGIRKTPSGARLGGNSDDSSSASSSSSDSSSRSDSSSGFDGFSGGSSGGGGASGSW